jgi:hypothetical protein
MVHIVRAVWEKVGEDNQLGRSFPPLTYLPEDANNLRVLEPAPRTVRGARDLLSVALQYGNAFGRGFQAAALKPADFFGNNAVLCEPASWPVTWPRVPSARSSRASPSSMSPTSRSVQPSPKWTSC